MQYYMIVLTQIKLIIIKLIREKRKESFGVFKLTYGGRLECSPPIHHIPTCFHNRLPNPITNEHQIGLLPHHLHILKICPRLYVYHKPILNQSSISYIYQTRANFKS